MKKILLFILLLLAQSALAQFYTGLMAGGRIPLGNNKLETLTIVPLGVQFQLRESMEYAVSLSLGGAMGGAKFPVSYTYPIDDYIVSPNPPYAPERVYKTEVSDNNSFLNIFGTLDVEKVLWCDRGDNYELGALLSIGLNSFSLKPKKELPTKPEHDKTQMIFGIGLRNSFVVSQGRDILQLNVQYWIENHTIKNHSPSLKGNYLSLTFCYTRAFLN